MWIRCAPGDATVDPGFLVLLPPHLAMDAPGIAVLHPQLDVVALCDVPLVRHLIRTLEIGKISSHEDVGQRQRRLPPIVATMAKII